MAGTAPLGRGWEAVGTATRASASPEVATGMLTNWGAVTASAFAAGVRASGVWHAGDTLGITLGQPLRVERASADFTYAAGQTSEGVLVFQTARVSRSPPDARSTWRLPTTAR